jgi:hypothetical protein
MLEKKANLGVAKNEQGWVIVDQDTKKGVRVPDEAMMQLTLAIWEFCDKMEPSEIVKKIIGPAKISAEQKGMVEKVVNESLNFFAKVGWAVEKKAGKKKAAKKKTTKKKK